MSVAKRVRIFNENQLNAVASALQSSEVLAYPSESVWGLGCDAFCEVALERIIELKKRPLEKGVIVLTDSVSRLHPLFADLQLSVREQILERVRSVSRAQMLHQRQAVTWLVPVSETVALPNLLTGSHQSLAVRITPHPMLKSLCAKLVTSDNPFGFLVSTSCNLSNQPSATTFEEAWSYFGDKINYLQADGLGFQMPSQIINALTGEIIR